MKNQISYSLEVRERAVRLVLEQQKERESQWLEIKSIASKIGYAAGKLRTWVRRAETNRGIRSGMSTPDPERLKELERENPGRFTIYR
jgi:transposase